MDRKIPRSRRLWRIVAPPLLVQLCGLCLLTSQTPAQERRFRGPGGAGGFRMPTPEETFSNLDADRNGRLDPAEIESNRFVARMLRNSDISRGMSRDEFLDEMQRIRDNFTRNGPGGPDSGRRRDRDNRNPARDGRPEENGDSTQQADPNSGNSTADGNPPNAATPQPPKPRPRVTIDLQQDLLPADTDRDGQLGLYEWRRFAGRSLKEFNELDRNHDGFVTPAEVALARPVPPTGSGAGQPATSPPTQPVPLANASSPAAGSPSVSGPAAIDGPPLPNNRAARDAERFFRLLDRNRDGLIAADEWRDGNTKTMFTTGGVDLSQPMSAEDFSQHYVRLSAAR